MTPGENSNATDKSLEKEGITNEPEVDGIASDIEVDTLVLIAALN